MTGELPQGAGAAIFAGGGAWRPRTDPRGATDDALLFKDPQRVLVADRPEDVRALLDEVEREQRKGSYAAGYLAYEAGAAFGLTVRTPAAEALPLAWMAVYEPESAVIMPSAEWRQLLADTDVARVARALAGVEPSLSVSRDEYVEAIGRVREYIAAGDTYQVNYTVRARFDLDPTPDVAVGPEGSGKPIDPLDYFLALVVRQSVPYAAYLDLGDSQIISLSPELFLRREGRRLESRPMKGTRPRGHDHAEDVALAYDLAETVKERAENLMIVDMVRNDLGRVCRAGTVRVPTLYAVEPYRTVWQMVSTVTGEARPDAPLSDLMQAVFPGASITGAPKHHTMELIAELETEPRGVYTGAVGLFMPGGDLTANIAIRTMVHRQGHCLLGTGSGVVWDADASAEYDETLVKAAFAAPPESGDPPRGGSWRSDPNEALHSAVAHDDFYLFETILLEPASTVDADSFKADQETESPEVLDSLRSLSEAAVLSRYRFLNEHMERMSDSAQALRLPFDRNGARDVLVGLARVRPESLVVRVQVDTQGHFSLSTRQAPAAPGGTVRLLLSPLRVDPDDPLLHHKTSMRGFYNREYRRATGQHCFDALFLNRLDHVTEGAISNVFVRTGERWLTPPLEDGLLPGVWRSWFVEQVGAVQRSLRLDDLVAADEIVAGNSVRGAVYVDELVTQPLAS